MGAWSVIKQQTSNWWNYETPGNKATDIGIIGVSIIIAGGSFLLGIQYHIDSHALSKLNGAASALNEGWLVLGGGTLIALPVILGLKIHRNLKDDEKRAVERARLDNALSLDDEVEPADSLLAELEKGRATTEKSNEVAKTRNRRLLVPNAGRIYIFC